MPNQVQVIRLSLDTRKPVFGVCDQVRFKPACSATDTSQSLEISAIASRGIILSRQRTTKALIRLRGCAGWSAPLLFAYCIRQIFSWRASILNDVYGMAGIWSDDRPTPKMQTLPLSYSGLFINIPLSTVSHHLHLPYQVFFFLIFVEIGN